MTPNDTDQPSSRRSLADQGRKPQTNASIMEGPQEVILAAWQDGGMPMEQVRLADGRVVNRRTDNKVEMTG